MLNPPRRLAAVVAGCVVTACAASLGAAGAVAASPSAADSSGATAGVTVFLAAPNSTALDALATSHDLSRAQRLHRLAGLLPSAAEQGRVVRSLRAAGLTVTDETAWSVSATGSTATVTTALGARPALAAQAKVPAGLHDAGVSAIFPTSGGPALRPASRALTGTDLRNAYASPASTGVPSKGSDRNGPLTVATVQFSNWNSADLTHYATAHGLKLAHGQYTGITVGKGPGDSDGDEEVDLDQESLLSTAPTADQRVYFAPNSNAGQAEAYSQVLDDVLQDHHAVGGGDPHIAAVSASWGNCESEQGNKSIQTLEPIFASLLAAGVTLFNSVGDDGIYDCGETAHYSNGRLVEAPSTSARVDFPGSSPYVIGVAGSTLTPVGSSAPNDGSNWGETGWSCSSPEDCEGSSPSDTGGSGGGVSASIAEPAWQTDDIGNPTYTSVGKRLVPDISADGNPATGFSIYTSDTDSCGGSHTCVYGGSSLAAPIATGLFTNLLARYGREAGIGDVLDDLYAGFAATKNDPVTSQVFRDITSGTNGDAANRGSDPAVTATSGYDTVSGLGGVIWSNAAPYLLSLSSPPRVTTRLQLSHPHSRTHSREVTASWDVHESSRGAGPASASVVIDRIGRSQPVYSHTGAPVSGHVTFTGAAAADYVMTVTGTDVLGHTTTAGSNTLAVPRDDKLFRLHGTWTRVKGSKDFAGSRAVTTSRSARAVAYGTGRRFFLEVQTGPTLGRLAVYRGATKLMTIDLYSAKSHHRTIEIFTATTRAKRTFTFRPTGSKDHASSGRSVDVDALVVKD